MRKLFFVFFFSFLLNAVWEFTQSPLYTNYMGGSITELILIRAAFWDAVIITIICLPFLFIPKINNHSHALIFIGVAIAIWIELYAMSTHRWAYAAAMPIIPFLKIGLVPVIQLGLLSYVTFEVADYEIK